MKQITKVESGISKRTQQPKFSSDWYSKPGVVYFIAAGQPFKAVKIGVTQKAKVEQRLRAIQCDNHEPVELLGVLVFDRDGKTVRDAEQMEQRLHGEFAAFQLIQDGRVGHEWFKAENALLSYIQANATPPEKMGFRRTFAKRALL